MAKLVQQKAEDLKLSITIEENVNLIKYLTLKRPQAR